MRAWSARVGMSILFVAGLVIGSPPPTSVAQAPMPPLDACLSKGSFDLLDRDCLEHRPRAGGAYYGSISGVTVVRVTRGTPVALQYGDGDIDFEHTTGRCGDRGCTYNRMTWSGAGIPTEIDSGRENLRFVSGCGATDVMCQVRYDPSFVGDRGELVTIVYGQLFDGIYAKGGHAWALYAPPLLYPAAIRAFDTSGTRVDVPDGYVAYAIRSGTDPTAAQCVAGDWYLAAAAGPTVSTPACVTLPRWAYLSGADSQFLGYLPYDSGTWTIVGHPQGDAAAPLLSRPSPYRHVTIRMGHDDLAASIVAEARPTVAIDLVPAETEMALGATQTVDVTVTAVGGEAGRLERLTFTDPEVLGLAPDGPLRVVGVTDGTPARFDLERGASRTVRVEIRAVTPGIGSIGAGVVGRDDIGGRAGAVVKAPARITVGVDPGQAGADAPRPPVVTTALDAGPAGPDVLTGTVQGTPGEEVTVTLASSPILSDDACDQQMTGPGVVAQGSADATIGDDGSGSFRVAAPALDPGRYVYGITVAATGVSAVGECQPVSVVTPEVRILDAEVTEGTAKRGTTELIVPIILSGPTDHDVQVHVTSSNGSATAPDDFERLSTTARIPAGARSTTVTVLVVPDADVEQDEELTLTLSAPVGATLATDDGATATATIVDDDDRSGDGVDLRGDWTVAAISDPIPRIEYSFVIERQDLATGDWSGAFILRDPQRHLTALPKQCDGRTCTFPVKGTLQGTRVTARISQGSATFKVTGTLKIKRGRMIVTLSGAGADGRKGTMRIERSTR